ELTVFDNLKLWYCDIPEKLKKDLKEDGILTRFGVDKMIKTKVSKLSGGMKKRVSIGCALAKNPPILILDEPGAALDFVLKGEIIAYMKDYMKQGGTIFLTSHEQGELSVCNRMFFIKNGISEEITSQLKSPDFFDWLTKQMENANET
ncbi:MAG: ATP-binding cassette domain-containing protein, partial [Lachnospiraceae bacterium]|nr:ATP-binding cassette domain-containing protein [Lachnospiraceae bacterium]